MYEKLTNCQNFAWYLQGRSDGVYVGIYIYTLPELGWLSKRFMEEA